MERPQTIRGYSGLKTNQIKTERDRRNYQHPERWEAAQDQAHSAASPMSQGSDLSNKKTSLEIHKVEDRKELGLTNSIK